METLQAGVRLAVPEDAGAITRFVEKCYQGTYPFAEGTSAQALSAGIADGSITYAVAEAATGEHAGQAALVRRGTAGLYEYGRAVVDPLRRGGGLLGKLSHKLLREAAPALGARFILGRPVTTHVFTQKNCRSLGFVDSGLLLGMLPAHTAFANGIAAHEQATSALIQILRVEERPRPRRVELEGRDGDRVAEFLDALGVPTLAPTASRSDPLGAFFERDRESGIVHLRFSRGAPPRRLHSGFIEGLEAAGTRLLWADVPVEDPEVARVSARLREIGLSFGAFIPLAGPKGEDVLRMQLCLDPIPLRREAIHVYDGAISLRDELFADARALEAAW